MSNRNIPLDLMRTLAIVLMVIFHFIYDLRYFGWVNWDIPNGDGWRHFRYVILTLFFLCIGASLVYSHQDKFHFKSFFFRLGKVAIGAILITLMSLVMFAQQWVYFGVLQFIIVASLFGALFIYLPKISLITGISIIMIALLGWINKRWPFDYINDLLPDYTTDFVPLFPWLGVILLGITLGHNKAFNRKIFNESPLTNLLAKPGKHSLIIYLLHQPLMFALLTPIHWLLN
ncbi:MAG: DUF1624 domain-containing protein [Colwellia sp.]|nr:DUF1624 domain-containing protein [Colwellia sp.]